MTSSGRGIAIDGDNYGIASTGDNAVNTILQIRLNGYSAEAAFATGLRSRDVPVLGTFGEADLVGRAEIIGQVAAELAAGMSVQLFGPPGVGKKAIARAVIRRLGAGPHPMRGVEVPPIGRPHTLETVYECLLTAFFTGVTFDPAQPQVRAAVATAGLAVVVVIPDCELMPEQLIGLFGMFPKCAFLLTSAHQTLYRVGAAHEISPLDLDAAAELIAQMAGHELAGLERLQVSAAFYLAGGRVMRLVQFGAFLRLTRNRPGPAPSSPLSPLEQVRLLAAGLSEPARRVLIALKTFGTDLAPEFFPAVIGLPGQPATGPGLSAAGPELLAAALVTRVSTASAAHGAGGQRIAYQITADAASAVDALGWKPASPLTAAAGLLPVLIRDRPEQPSPGPALLLTIAAMLNAAGQHRDASVFIRAALPVTLRGGHVLAWTRLLGLGLQAATAAGPDAGSDLAYFTREDDTRRRLVGDSIAIATALAAAHAAGPAPAHQAGAHGGSQAGTHGGLHAVRHLGSVLRRSARYGAKASSAGHSVAATSTIALGSAVVVAAAVTATVLAVRNSGDHAPAPTAFSVTEHTQRFSSRTNGILTTATAQYPVVTGLTDQALAQRINTELRAPVEQQVTALQASIKNGAPATLGSTVYRAGKLLSVRYLTIFGSANSGSSLRAVTIRIDTGVVLGPKGILTAAALTSRGRNTLATDLQARKGISDCAGLTGTSGGRSIAPTLAKIGTSHSEVVINVTPAGIAFTFAETALGGPLACTPFATLPLSELSGLVSPSVISLAVPAQSAGP